MNDQNELKVSLELFEGPMDLLLYLIKKNHIEITDIPIATVLEQYLEYLELMRLCDVNVASEYMVIAATLIQIKARMLIPQNENAQQEDEEDPRDELVRRLMEYQKFKEAAQFLREKEINMQKHVTRSESISDYRPEKSNLKVSMFDLMTAFKEALKNIPKDVFFEVMKDEYTVEEKREFIAELIIEQDRVNLTELFGRCRTKMELISTFLAVLELVKMKKIDTVQDGLFGGIVLMKKEVDDTQALENQEIEAEEIDEENESEDEAQEETVDEELYADDDELLDEK